MDPTTLSSRTLTRRKSGSRNEWPGVGSNRWRPLFVDRVTVGRQKSPLIANGRVSWFKLDKKFGFVELDRGMGDAFLHVSVLKEAGYVSVPAGTTLQVRVEHERGRQRIVEVLSVDTRTANPGEPPPVVRKQPLKRAVGGEGDDES